MKSSRGPSPLELFYLSAAYRVSDAPYSQVPFSTNVTLTP